jgi:hypothetical protein
MPPSGMCDIMLTLQLQIFFRTNPSYIVDEKANENLKKTIIGSKSSKDEEWMEIMDKDEIKTSIFDCYGQCSF